MFNTTVFREYRLSKKRDKGIGDQEVWVSIDFDKANPFSSLLLRRNREMFVEKVEEARFFFLLLPFFPLMAFSSYNTQRECFPPKGGVPKIFVGLAYSLIILKLCYTFY